MPQFLSAPEDGLQLSTSTKSLPDAASDASTSGLRAGRMESAPTWRWQAPHLAVDETMKNIIGIGSRSDTYSMIAASLPLHPLSSKQTASSDLSALLPIGKSSFRTFHDFVMGNGWAGVVAAALQFCPDPFSVGGLLLGSFKLADLRIHGGCGGHWFSVLSTGNRGGIVRPAQSVPAR